MTSFANLFNLLLPIGFGLLVLLGGLFAHRGFATKGTWTVLISAEIFLVSLIASLAFTLIETPFGYISNISIWGWLMVLSIFSLCIGAFLMTNHWRTLSQETAELEKLAVQLAAEREELETRASSTGFLEPLSSPTKSDSLAE